MTHQNNSDFHNLILQLLNDHGTESFAECIRILVNEAMRQERSSAIQAALYQRYNERLAHANGYKTKIVEKLCGHSVSSTQVSNCVAKLDEELQAWREQPLRSFSYLVLDARYEKVR